MLYPTPLPHVFVRVSSIYSRSWHGKALDSKAVIFRNVTRTGIVLVTAIVATWTPYFGTMLGQVGGLTDALQAFVLPPLIYMSIHKSQLTSSQKTIYRGIILWGVVTITYTMYTLLRAMLASS